MSKANKKIIDIEPCPPERRAEREQFWKESMLPYLKSKWGSGFIFEDDHGPRGPEVYLLWRQIFVEGRYGPVEPGVARHEEAWRYAKRAYIDLFLLTPVQNPAFWDAFFNRYLPVNDITPFSPSVYSATNTRSFPLCPFFGDMYGGLDLVRRYNWRLEDEVAWFRQIYGERWSRVIDLMGRKRTNPYGALESYEQLIWRWVQTLGGKHPADNVWLHLYDYWKSTFDQFHIYPPRCADAKSRAAYDEKLRLLKINQFKPCNPDPRVYEDELEEEYGDGDLTLLFYALAFPEETVRYHMQEHERIWNIRNHCKDAFPWLIYYPRQHMTYEEVMAQPALIAFRGRLIDDLENGDLPQGMKDLWQTIKEDKTDHYVKRAYREKDEEYAKMMASKRPVPEEALPWDKTRVKQFGEAIEPLRAMAAAYGVTDIKAPVKTLKRLVNLLWNRQRKARFFANDDDQTLEDIAEAVLLDDGYTKPGFVMPEQILRLEYPPIEAFESDDPKTYYRDAWRQIASMVRLEKKKVGIVCRNAKEPDQCTVTVKVGKKSYRYQYSLEYEVFDEQLLHDIEDFAAKEKLKWRFHIDRDEDQDGVSDMFVFYLPDELASLRHLGSE
ncbi:hypothetical protein [Thiolapillus brandeum]|nr:hypothetical protein [Thiolapillus brandeum]